MANSVVFEAQNTDGSWNAVEALGGVGLQIVGGENADGRLETFYIDERNNIYHNWQIKPGGIWNGPSSFGGQALQLVLLPDAHKCLNLFYIGMDNFIHRNFQKTPSQGDWQYQNLNVKAKSISAGLNTDGRLEVFYVDMNDNIAHVWQSSVGSLFSASEQLPGRARQIVVQSNLDGRLEFIYIGLDNGMYNMWQPSPSNGPYQSGGLGGQATYIALGKNGDGRLEVFYSGTDFKIYHNWQTSPGGSWNGEQSFGGSAHQLAVAANSRGLLELFYVGLDGYIYHNWQTSNGWGGGVRNSQANAVYAATRASDQNAIALFYLGSNELPPPQPIILTHQLVSGGLAALGGWITVTINSDGSVRWQGEAYDHGLDGYDYSVSVLVTTPNGPSIALAHSGTVGGTFTSGDRRDFWDVTYPNAIGGMFSSFSNASLYSNLQYTSDFGTFASGLIDWAIKFSLGSVAPGIGVIIFIGLEVYSEISTGSLVEGAIISEGILWMAGPLNTLISLGAAAIVKLGSQSRKLTQEEYDWANGPSLYAGALPGIDRLLVTDASNGDRAFTFPRWDGKIALNLGPVGYIDPRNFPGHKPGEVFIHELLHACQIVGAPSSLDLMACAISAKVCGDTSAYKYPDAGPNYLHFGLEQQAQVVGDWASGTVRSSGGNQTGKVEDAASPYYTYIVNNVRNKNLWATL